MSKPEIIAAIRQCNPSAGEAFLATFPEATLEQYLARLTQLKDHRGRSTVWVRPEMDLPLISPPRAA